ncbi:sodium-dependent multivitamin transporter-like isoform X3 [Homarus americanus]|uniref:sodium-dependent multivitamin transporter-like isoform X3 n=1 Tax=Homarus americanus TaxID=6706 RepID=UPI001C4389F7|nr:sodium-dependent multivitamin transporter-like isoform X3 [Homarus americanus]
MTSVSGGTFTWLDYGVFILMLLASLLVGFYFAYKSRNKANDEFLLGSRSLTCVPVSMSLVVTYISAIALQGSPAEIYYHNIQTVCGNVGLLAVPIAALVFVPFYYELQLVSVNQGGLKAVVWTDALQFMVLLGGIVAVIIKGMIEIGGLGKVWEIAVKHDRAGPQIFNWKVDVFERHTVFGIAWSGFHSTLSTYCCSQTAIQRYSSMKNLKHAYMSMFLIIPYYALLSFLMVLTGLVLFATYAECDPLKAGLISSKDQILPFYVIDRLNTVPGLAGLFTACLFSGALSTISSGVNSQAAVTWEDWLVMIPRCASLPKSTQAFITKILALVYGMIAVGLAFLAGSMGGVLQAAIAVTFAVAGPLMAAFIMAIFMPFTNAKGSCAAMILGTVIALGFHFGSIAVGITPELLPTSTDGCPANLTIPTLPQTPIVRVSDLDYPKKLLGLSYTLLGTLGFLVAIVIGIFISIITGRYSVRSRRRQLYRQQRVATEEMGDDLLRRTWFTSGCTGASLTPMTQSIFILMER